MGKSIEERAKEAKREYEEAKRKFCQTVGISYEAADSRDTDEESALHNAPQQTKPRVTDAEEYSFFADELEAARRHEALRRHASSEYREKLNKPGYVVSALVLLTMFFFIKILCFSSPYSLGNIALGVVLCIVVVLIVIGENSW